MQNRILGLHHITAIAGNAQRNYEFYTRVLGLRLVKKTVNFDDPGTYHFYFGNETGEPGTILTFFPWEGIRPGRPGAGMATGIGYTVPKESLGFWIDRFDKYNVKYEQVIERFGEQVLSFQDPDGLLLHLIENNKKDNRIPWTTADVNKDVAIIGFHSIELTLNNVKATAGILSGVFGYQLLNREGNRYRFTTDAIETANVVDLVEAPGEKPGVNAGGTNHHVAFRVKDEEVLMEFRKKILALNLGITDKIDRNYFYSLYFREPGGVLFEIATDNPGFATDEQVSELGTSLKLPSQYEKSRKQIEELLPVLH